MTVSRRDFIQSAAALLGAAACAPRESTLQPRAGANEAMLLVRPANPTRTPTLGLEPLGLSRGMRDGAIYVPPTYSDSNPSPLIVLLHGAKKPRLPIGDHAAGAGQEPVAAEHE